MLKIKKIFTIILCCITAFCGISISEFSNIHSYAVELSEPTKYNLPIKKNGMELVEIEVYEFNGKYFTTPQNIADLTRTEYIDAGIDPIYGGKSFVFRHGVFEATVDVENQKMYSCITGYSNSIRDSIKSTISVVKGYLNIEVPVQTYSELKEIVTDDMIAQINLPDSVIDEFLYAPEHILEQKAIDNIDLDVINVDSKYMIEFIPWLKYLGADCNIGNDCLKVNVPYRTLWESIMPNMHQNTHNKVIDTRSDFENAGRVIDSVLADVVSDLPGFWWNAIKDSIVDIADTIYTPFTEEESDFQSDDKYVEEAIYDILKVDYIKSNDFTGRLEEINSNAKEVNVEIDFIHEGLTNTLPYFANSLPDGVYDKLCDEAIKIDSLKSSAEVLIFVLDSCITISDRLNIDEDTKRSLEGILNQNIDQYVEEKAISGKWSITAKRVLKNLSRNENVASDVIINKGAEWLIEQATDKGLEMFGNTNYCTLSMELIKELLINSPYTRPTWDGYNAQIYMIKQNEIQVDTLQLIDSLLIKASNENYSEIQTLNDLTNVLKFYYRTVIAHANNSVKYLDEINVWNEYRDEFITEYNAVSTYTTKYLFNISNCTVKTILSYSEIKDDILTADFMAKYEINDSDPTELYADVLDYYYYHISNNWAGVDYDNVKYDVSFLWYQYEQNATLDFAGYQFVDIDNDGTVELLVETGKDRIIDIFTIVDGEIIHLIESNYRGSCYLCEGNDIFITDSSSTFCGEYQYFRIKNGKCELYEAFHEDSDDYSAICIDDVDSHMKYFIAENIIAYKDSISGEQYYDYNLKSITKDEFKKGTDKHKIRELSLIPFSEYTPINAIETDQEMLKFINSVEVPLTVNNLLGNWYSESQNIAYIFTSTGMDTGITSNGLQIVSGKYVKVNLNTQESISGAFDIDYSGLHFYYGPQANAENTTIYGEVTISEEMMMLDSNLYKKVSPNIKKQIEGTWTNNNGYIKFSEDGFKEYCDGKCITDEKYYVLSNELLSIDNRVYEYSITGKQLSLFNTTYTKSGDDNSAAVLDNLQDSIVGAWVSSSSEYVLFKDGTYQYNTVSYLDDEPWVRTNIESGTYEIYNYNTIRLHNDNSSPLSWTEAIYDIASGTLSIGGSNNTFTKREYKKAQIEN